MVRGEKAKKLWWLNDTSMNSFLRQIFFFYFYHFVICNKIDSVRKEDIYE